MGHRSYDSVMSYVNRSEARRAGASTASKSTTIWQMVLTTAGISLAMMALFHITMF